MRGAEEPIRRGGRKLTRIPSAASFVVISILLPYCSGPGANRDLILAGHSIHLEESLNRAEVRGSEAPKDLQDVVEWRFDRPGTDWSPVALIRGSARRVAITRMEDALRLYLDERVRWPRADVTRYSGGVFVDLADWRREDWAYIVVAARAQCAGGTVTLEGKLNKRPDGAGGGLSTFADATESVDIIADGKVHSYLVRADWSPGEYSGYARWHDPWTQLGLQFVSDRPATIDIFEVRVIPKEAKYAAAPAGTGLEVRGSAYRRALYMHTPGSISYRVRIPEAGRLDVGLGVLHDDPPVTFRVRAMIGRRAQETLFEEDFADKTGWGQRSIDLSPFAGMTAEITLEADGGRAGEVAFWAAPTISGSRPRGRPNIILYIIDGGAAGQMSVYGYNRRTTPCLERLAAEGAVFEHAYSNSSWTKISVPSFMTSLHSSVLGPLLNPSDRLPPESVTMAEHMHRAGYQTAVFVSNPHCGTMSGLDRGVDVLRESGVEPNSRSSEELQADFWTWRREYPGGPFWAHIQATDVHIPWAQDAPFAGLYVDPALQKTYLDWLKKIGMTEGRLPDRFGKAGIDPARFGYLARALYDETMAHQDDQIGRFVERLKAEGEWDRTIFIVAADHGSSGAGLMPIDPAPAAWGVPNLAASVTGIPLILCWPGRVRPGQRIREAVSMIDLLPTALELAGLPEPDVAQGGSFVPLITGRKGWEPKPVIIDEFNMRADTGDVYGTIDVIDGRWGASLKVGTSPGEEDERPEHLRPAPLLLYDLWNDPQCLRSLHAGRPEMVRKYREYLEGRLREHRALARKYTRAGSAPLNAEQIETLRTLGYIR